MRARPRQRRSQDRPKGKGGGGGALDRAEQGHGLRSEEIGGNSYPMHAACRYLQYDPPKYSAVPRSCPFIGITDAIDQPVDTNWLNKTI